MTDVANLSRGHVLPGKSGDAGLYCFAKGVIRTHKVYGK